MNKEFEDYPYYVEDIDVSDSPSENEIRILVQKIKDSLDEPFEVYRSLVNNLHKKLEGKIKLWSLKNKNFQDLNYDINQAIQTQFNISFEILMNRDIYEGFNNERCKNIFAYLHRIFVNDIYDKYLDWCERSRLFDKRVRKIKLFLNNYMIRNKGVKPSQELIEKDFNDIPKKELKEIIKYIENVPILNIEFLDGCEQRNPSPETIAERNELIEEILAVIEETPDLYQKVFYYFYFEEKSHKEIAEIVNKTPKTCINILSDLYGIIRERLINE